MERPPEIEKSRRWPQILAVLITVILVMSSGLHAGWTSPAKSKLQNNDMNFNVTSAETSYLVMIYPLGYIIASPISSFLLEKVGRKYALICLAFPQMFAWFLIAVATKIQVLYVSRLIAGCAEGSIYCIVPIYICEVSEPFIRGRLGICFTTALTFGYFLINCYGSYMHIRTSAYVSICWPVIFLCTFIWMPETPYYFLIKGDTENARISLQRLRRMKNVETELANLITDVQTHVSESATYKDVFCVKTNLKAVFIIMGLRTMQQFTGGASVIYYNQKIFGEVSGTLTESQSAIIFTGCLTVVNSLAIILVDRYGRRPLLFISLSGTALSVLMVTIYFVFKDYGYNANSIRWMPLIGMVLFTITRGFGLLSIPTLLSGELLSPKIKGKAMGIIIIYVSLLMSGTSKIFHTLYEHFGMHMPFAAFTVWATVGIVFVYYCVPETKHKTLEEIQLSLK